MKGMTHIGPARRILARATTNAVTIPTATARSRPVAVRSRPIGPVCQRDMTARYCRLPEMSTPRSRLDTASGTAVLLECARVESSAYRVRVRAGFGLRHPELASVLETCSPAASAEVG